LELALFAVSMLWAAVASNIAGRAAAGISGRLGLVYGQTLLESGFLLFLVVIGYQGLAWSARWKGERASVLPLPRRSTSVLEWGTGVAIGWGLCLAAVLPSLLSGKLHAVLNRGVGLVPSVLAAIATLLIACLAEEAIFRGYPFRRLTMAVGPTFATIFMSLLFSLVLIRANFPVSVGRAVLDSTLFGVILAMAYLRTHALWLGWGLHFGYRVVMAVLIGLPIVGRSDFGSILSSTTRGPVWLTGGDFGLDAALLTAFVMIAGMILLYRVSRDWAWAYTLPEIKPAGYEVTVAPPAAHVAMEKSTQVAPPPLVQILPSTPQSFSAAPPRGRNG
jgi:membrane protease YdiL (CAAX protease family)